MHFPNSSQWRRLVHSRTDTKVYLGMEAWLSCHVQRRPAPSKLCPGLKAYSAHHWIIKRERTWSNAASRKIPFHLRLSTDATGVRQTCIPYGISTALERFPRGCPPHAVRSRRSDDVLPPKIALEVVLTSFSFPLSSSSARKFPSFVG